MSDPRTDALEATGRVVARDGVRDLSLEQVAAESGISVEAITDEFGDRGELLRRAFEHADGRAQARLEGEIRSGPALERLTKLLTLYLDDAEDIRQDWIFWIEMEAAALFDEEIRTEVERQTDQWVGMVAGLIAVGLTDRSIPAGVDSEAAAFRLAMMQDGFGRACAMGLLAADRAREAMTDAIELELGGTQG